MRILLCCMALLVSLGLAANACAADKPLKIGFIYVSPVGDEGWSFTHDQGRKALEKLPGVTTSFVESVNEGPDAERVMRKMARDGYDIIFATSFGFMDYMAKVAKDYPKVTFMHCSGYKTLPNMSAYFGRMYQARYLSGMVAGAMTKKNSIGYVAAHPIPEVVRGINAFTLGVRAVNPQAEVRVVWTKTWYDPATEKEAAKSLLDLGVDLITQHQDSLGPQEAAAERGAWVVGYNSDTSKAVPKVFLTAPVWNWVDFYVDVVNQIRAGTWKSGNFWPGIETGIVGLAPFGPMVPEEVRAKVEAAKQDIISGKLVVFSGPVLDQNGKERIAAGKHATDQELLSMDWFVQGVVGSIK